MSKVRDKLVEIIDKAIIDTIGFSLNPSISKPIAEAIEAEMELQRIDCRLCSHKRTKCNENGTICPTIKGFIVSED